MPIPSPGEVLHVTRTASVQFLQPIRFRVIRVHDEWETYEGWIWLDGYELGADGDAVARRRIWVQIAGLIRVAPAAKPQPPRRPTNRGPGSLPNPTPADRARS